MRLINEFVQVQSEFFEGYWNNDFDIDPVVIAGFFLDGGRYCERSIHNLHRDLPKRRRRILGLVLNRFLGLIGFRHHRTSINANSDQRYA